MDLGVTISNKYNEDTEMDPTIAKAKREGVNYINKSQPKTSQSIPLESIYLTWYISRRNETKNEICI